MRPLFSRLIFVLLIFGTLAGIIFLSAPRAVWSASRPAGQLLGSGLGADGFPEISESQMPVLTLPAPSPTPTPPISNTISHYLPLIVSTKTPALELLNVYTRDEDGSRRAAFLPGEPHSYHAEGLNNRTAPLTATLQFYQSGPCGTGLMYSDTITLLPGVWGQAVSSPGLNCTGIYTTTVHLDHKNLSPTLSTLHAINPPSTVLVSGFQGFDRCHLPSVEEMQVWWDSSPYYVYNLYLGGISFFCWEEIPDPVWVHQVAQQGWTFIQAWVGPQAPCTSFTHRMSANAGVAYTEGRAEATAAAGASQRAGLFENGVIYYDIEGYPNASTECRNAVSSFLRGWTERLHELGLRSGSYGSPCNSYITDWAAINPPPDDVWVAHWYRPSYDPAATVWDIPCLSNSLWANHRRIKQYAGGHVETWGGVAFEIDTDVLDGEITGLLLDLDGPINGAPQVVVSQAGRPLNDIKLLGIGQGWVLVESQLLRTADDGASWQDITPPGFQVIDASFLDLERGWVLGRAEPGGQLQIARTLDGGLHWSIANLPVNGPAETARIETGWLDVVDGRTVWVALKLQSGSSFSLGRLFGTRDGGQVWHERSLPLGGLVHFINDRLAWAAGGPDGDSLFRTQDGGRSWSPFSLELPSGVQASIGLPTFTDERSGQVSVMLDMPDGQVLARYATQDSGLNWRKVGEQSMAQWVDSGLLLTPDLAEVWAGRAGLGGKLPSGTVAADFLDDQHGWAIVQQGSCIGKPDGSDNIAPPFSNLVYCERAWRLLATDDGGQTWGQILD